MLLATVSIGSNFTYSPTQAHVFAVAAALTVLHALVNSMSTAWLNHLTGTYAVVHITALVAVCITLLVVTGDKHSAEYVFTDVEPHSGWPTGFSFFFGFLSAAWTMTNAGATGQ